eukprot:1608051-Amphidinium_carterae.2
MLRQQRLPQGPFPTRSGQNYMLNPSGNILRTRYWKVLQRTMRVYLTKILQPSSPQAALTEQSKRGAQQLIVCQGNALQVHQALVPCDA